jgi:hypothetical protein
MKTIQLIALGLAATFAISCSSDPVYVPVYVPTEKKTTKTYVKPKPKETAEGFRAVEKPTTYSN